MLKNFVFAIFLLVSTCSIASNRYLAEWGWTHSRTQIETGPYTTLIEAAESFCSISDGLLSVEDAGEFARGICNNGVVFNGHVYKAYACPQGGVYYDKLCINPPECPDGFSRDFVSGACLNQFGYSGVSRHESLKSCHSTDNPISIGIGDKHLDELDFPSVDGSFSDIYRHYNSLSIDRLNFVRRGWRFSFEKRLAINATSTLIERQGDCTYLA